MQFELDGKVVFVTGAGSGIGRSIAVKLAQNGADVAVNDVRPGGAEETVARLEEFDCDAIAAVADISDYEAVRGAVEKTIDHYGRIDVLVNNAGWDHLVPFMKTEPDDWEKYFDINLRGPLNVTHVVSRHMSENGGGNIVSVASDAGRVGSMGQSIYSACKGGIIAISKTWAREFARDDIRVNVVSPGLTDTPLLDDIREEGFGGKVIDAIINQIPFGLGEPDQVANAVLFFVSDASEYITGQVLSVSGGLSMSD